MIRAGDSAPSILNVPNLITIARILMAPVFFWMLLADAGELGPLRWAAAAVFVIGIATDSIDGHLARSRNLVTDFGKLMDPIADKALTGGALVCLALLGELAWWVVIVILAREIGITIYRMLALRDRVIPASRGGKLKTVLQAVAISFFLAPLWIVLGDWVHWLNGALMTAAVAATLVSGLDYVVAGIRERRRA
ncbi:CDP-diacylglycerol--glycerol-3-phosphate 3-phosphatidyltransferase [Salinibacterium sp. SYSU T00001]|uniref:CDP-diacylglycerol--glycerol-3-phosphate 3-phosphatidyltransferase n=1 Tax=Homoserinimonas sedimenticola TaxID=2986805 RepID=UPI0022367EDD|nr:CDP-diacylglycerol--glycerol-3-phosphate 3-phosphatidyltransferase [Salinibacterium sedimenticola]MCW4386763.1 CDP-diacylglycerol--glycerol-3-phosphate 3-phosphatidyltransferase [Salinibacterium sedimenticola]